jgi:hypothetical protein
VQDDFRNWLTLKSTFALQWTTFAWLADRGSRNGKVSEGWRAIRDDFRNWVLRIA